MIAVAHLCRSVMAAIAPIALAAAAALAGSGASAQPAAIMLDAGRCAALAGRTFDAAKIASADPVAAGTGWSQGVDHGPGAPIAATRSFCRVQGTIETEIRFELWLPLAGGWNGKLLGAGVGGDAGRFNYADLPRGVSRGYAAATTDTGHRAEDRRWMLGDPARLDNYTHRANHLLAVAAKAIIADVYGAAPSYSYFIGCSGGGRQGLKEMQLYPDDYDGVVSGAGGPDTPEMTTRRMWELNLRDRNGGLMAPADWALVARAGVAACDAADGVRDGIAENPLACRFRVSDLLCAGAKEPGRCLDARQVAFAARFYAPLTDAAGRQLDGGLLPGVLVDSGRSQLALGTFGQAIRHRTEWDGADFDLARDRAAIGRVMPELRADRADLSRFAGRGGKAILYSGWMDPAVAARMMVAYREAVVRATGGAARADGFFRLYMLPGMYHCGGGPGADRIGGAGADGVAPDAQHDLLSALETWVEQGRAPQTMIAAKVEDGKVVRTHPICTFPKQARFDGHGSPDDTASYTCA